MPRNRDANPIALLAPTHRPSHVFDQVGDVVAALDLPRLTQQRSRVRNPILRHQSLRMVHLGFRPKLRALCRLLVTQDRLLIFAGALVRLTRLYQRGTRLQRFTTDETLRYSPEGAVHSAELEGLLRFSTPLGLRGSPLLNGPTEALMQIRGSGGRTMTIEPSCLFPGVCRSLDLRIDADGDEDFEESLSSNWQASLPP